MYKMEAEAEFNALLRITPLGKAWRLSKITEFGEMRRYIETESLVRVQNLSKAADLSRMLSQHFEHVEQNPLSMLIKDSQSRPQQLHLRTIQYIQNLQQQAIVLHHPQLQWVRDTRITGLRSQESVASQTYSVWLSKTRVNMLQRLHDFDTSLTRMHEDYTYLSSAIRPDSPFLLHQAHLSRAFTAAGVEERLGMLSTSYVESTQPIDMKNAQLSHQLRDLYDTLVPQADHESLDTFMTRYTRFRHDINRLERLWYTHAAGDERPHRVYLSQNGDQVGISTGLRFRDEPWSILYADVPPLEPFLPISQPYPLRVPYDVTNQNPFGGELFGGERLSNWKSSRAV